jgi:hypothetical protein
MTTPPPAYPEPAAPAGTDRTTLWGWLGIIFGLICCGILGIIFGAISVSQAKKYSNSPVLGYIAIGVGALTTIVGGIVGASRIHG